ncbi:MAG: hypothetical protein WAU60_13335 [Candidatus Competibacter denitrificans]|jgi:hypothetical protein
MLNAALVEVSEYGNGVINTETGELVEIQSAPLPMVYERATKALAECSRIDECKDWANKAEALASYARQSKDDSLRKMADRIQARAIRRCGELLKQIEAGKNRFDERRHDGSDTPINRTEAAAQAGLSERQKVTALRVANVPQPVFEEAVESESPPTVTQLAEIGKQAKFPVPAIDLEGIDPAHFARATELKGSLSRLASFCEKQDPSAIAKAFKPQEIKTVRQYLAVIESWFDCFVVNLE